MNDKGDFYIGNTKIASASGQQTTFDIPVPTITGEDPNRLSLVADEVIVKERLLVEGGASKQILSQFDGIAFNSDLRLSDNTKQLITEASLRAQDAKFRDTLNSTATTNGAVVIDGGVGIAKSVYIGGDITGSGTFDGQSNISGITSVTASFANNEGFFGNGAGLTNTGSTLGGCIWNRKSRSHRFNNWSDDNCTTDADLTFDASTNTLSSVNFSGALVEIPTTATTATNVSGLKSSFIQ